MSLAARHDDDDPCGSSRERYASPRRGEPLRNRWVNFVLLLVWGIVLPLESAAQDADIAAIREVQMQQAQAWNRHDATAYAALFTADGDVVNVLGWRWRGRAEIESKLKDAFAWVFRDSTLTFGEVDVRLLDPVTAVAHARWTMDGAKVPPGAPQPPRQGIQLQVLRKEVGRWRIAAFQNTNSFPEMPFPKGPPASTP